MLFDIYHKGTHFEVVAHGSPTPEDIRTTAQALVAHPQWRSDARVLADYFDADTSHWGENVNYENAKSIYALSEQIVGCRVAYVAGSTVNFGTLRALISHLPEDFSAEFRVFMTMKEAMRWLRLEVEPSERGQGAGASIDKAKCSPQPF